MPFMWDIQWAVSVIFLKHLIWFHAYFFLSAQVFLSDMLDKWSNIMQVICIWNNTWILVSVAVKSDTFQSDASCIHLLIDPSITKSVYLSIYSSIDLCLYLSINSSINLSIDLSIYLSIYIYIYIYIYIFICLSIYSLNKTEWICSLFKEWILEKSEIRVNLEWTFVLFTHFGVTTGITQIFRVIPEVTPKWVNNTHVHSKFTPNSL